MEYRIPKKGVEFWVPKEDFLTAIHYCRRYDDFKLRLDYGVKAVNNDGMPHAPGGGDQTAASAIMNAEYKRRIDMIEAAVKEAGADIYDWLLIGVTKGYNYIQLQQLGIPCSRNYYYARRRQVYYIISKKI